MSDTSQSYLDELNPQQRAAVEYLDGPQLVIAGAGSGKTRVITYKILHLLNQGVPPWRILALTFTNKAAREMRERIELVAGAENASRLWMGTFHSIFSKILHARATELGFSPNFTIYDTPDSRNAIKQIVESLELDSKVYKPATVLGQISMAKNALVTPEMYAASRETLAADTRAGRPRIAQIYAMYMERCRQSNAMDFDDLLYYTNQLFDSRPDITDIYRDKFLYLLVDEYQDTNACQHRIVEKLARTHGRLCVVGDDAQSIYSFRGANIGNILHLREDFPTLKVFKLERNYRSTQNIINAAGSLIANNREQIPKNVYSENSKGDRIEVVKCYSDTEESFKVAARISQRRVSTGDHFSDFAVLYRTNAQSRALEEALRKRNIPYRIYGGLSFYQRKEVKDALAYFRLAVNPDDDEALRRVINYPQRGIGDTTVQRIARAAIKEGVSLWRIISDHSLMPPEVKSAARKKLEAFADMANRFISMASDGISADELAYTIIKDTKLLEQFAYDRTPENISKSENINELMNSVRAFVEMAREEGQTANDMVAYLNTVSLATDQDSDDSGSDDRVTLMTAHSAKGLEFNNVFIVGVEDGLFPSLMSSDSIAGVEEERRLLYVAITRARNFCQMSYATTRFRNGTMMNTTISPFLKEIDGRYLNGVSNYTVPSRTESPSKPRIYSVPPSMAGSAVSLGTLRHSSTPEPTASATAKADGNFVTHQPQDVNSGTRIHHPRFGTGQVVNVMNDGIGPRMIVRFENDDVDERTLLFKYAKFAIL